MMTMVYVESDVIIKMSMARIRDVYDPFRDHFVYIRLGLYAAPLEIDYTSDDILRD